MGKIEEELSAKTYRLWRQEELLSFDGLVEDTRDTRQMFGFAGKEYSCKWVVVWRAEGRVLGTRFFENGTESGVLDVSKNFLDGVLGFWNKKHE